MSVMKVALSFAVLAAVIAILPGPTIGGIGVGIGANCVAIRH
jgi:hypothetical protein